MPVNAGNNIAKIIILFFVLQFLRVINSLTTLLALTMF